jgi:fatty acid-binding protein DegV
MFTVNKAKTLVHIHQKQVREYNEKPNKNKALERLFSHIIERAENGVHNLELSFDYLTQKDGNEIVNLLREYGYNAKYKLEIDANGYSSIKFHIWYEV